MQLRVNTEVSCFSAMKYGIEELYWQQAVSELLGRKSRHGPYNSAPPFIHRI